MTGLLALRRGISFGGALDDDRPDAGRWLREAHFEAVRLEPYMLGGRLWAMVYFQGASKPCVRP